MTIPVNQQPVLGGVYYVSDVALSMPPNNDRNYHNKRTVLVVSGTAVNRDASRPSVTVAPISGSQRWRSPDCVRLQLGDGGVTKPCWVRVPHLQPILKADLADFLGVLPAAKVREVQAHVAQYLGLLDTPTIG